MRFELYFEYFARHLHFTVTELRRIAAVAIYYSFQEST